MSADHDTQSRLCWPCSRHRPLCSARRSGFTLLEIMVAMAIVALVLVALNTFVFSMGELWGQNSDLRLYELHVRNVTRYLERELHTAGLPPSSTASNPGIVVKEVRGQNGVTQALLTYELPAGSRLLAWEDRPLPDVICSLAVREREGLYLYWQSRLEKRYGDDAPREVLITPYITGLTYEYYDTDFKNWKSETTPRKNDTGKYDVPGRIRLKFSYDGRTKETFIGIPTAAEGLPAL